MANPKHRGTSADNVVLDCERGREMGCESFCCRLIVRLAPGERDPGAPDDERKRCVDKDPGTGRCIHQDPRTGWCTIWERRPAVCRAYDCNDDPRLQVVLKNGFRSLVHLMTSNENGGPRLRVPYLRRSRRESPK